MSAPVRRLVHKVFDPIRQSAWNGYFNDDDGKAVYRRRILLENFYINALGNLTSGVFLTGIILYILKNESVAVQNNYLGLVASIPLIASVVQVIAPVFLAKMKSYKPIMVITRSLYVFINTVVFAVIPLLPIKPTTSAGLLIGALLVSRLALGVPNPAIYVWHIAHIPDDKRADWMTYQQMLTLIWHTVVSLVAGFIIDKFELHGMYMAGVLLIRGLLLIDGFFELRSHFIIKEEPHPPVEKISFKEIFIVPLTCVPFLCTVLIYGLWTIGTNISVQYFNAYMLDSVGVSYTFINACTATNIPIMFITMPIWNKMVHEKGWLFTLAISSGLFSIPFILYCFVFRQTYMLYLVAIIIYNAIIPGANLVFANLCYLKNPPGKTTSCVAFYFALGSAIGFLGTYLGKIFINNTDSKIINIGKLSIVNNQYVGLIAAGISIFICVFCFILDRLDKKDKLRVD